MILPPRPACTSARATACARKNGTLRFTSITASQSSSLKVSASSRRMMPALLTRISTRPASLDGLRDDVRGFVAALQVRVHRVELAARGGDAALGIRGAGARDADDVGARLRQRDRDALPEPGVGAGDERDLAVQRERGERAARGWIRSRVLCGHGVTLQCGVT